MKSLPNIRIALATKAVKHFVESGEISPCPENLPNELKIQSGTFVSIKRKSRLRGCIGSVLPQTENLAKEIIQNAIYAASRDPRFSPILKSELPDLTFSIDVLSSPEKVKSITELDCRRFGVIVKHDGQQGILLPNLDGVDTVKKQIQICLEKARLKKESPFEIFRFESKRYK